MLQKAIFQIFQSSLNPFFKNCEPICKMIMIIPQLSNLDHITILHFFILFLRIILYLITAPNLGINLDQFDIKPLIGINNFPIKLALDMLHSNLGPRLNLIKLFLNFKKPFICFHLKIKIGFISFHVCFY